MNESYTQAPGKGNPYYTSDDRSFLRIIVAGNNPYNNV